MKITEMTVKKTTYIVMLKIQINMVGDIYLTCIGEAAKKFFYQRPFRGEGGKRPAIEENNFF